MNKPKSFPEAESGALRLAVENLLHADDPDKMEAARNQARSLLRITDIGLATTNKLAADAETIRVFRELIDRQSATIHSLSQQRIWALDLIQRLRDNLHKGIRLLQHHGGAAVMAENQEWDETSNLLLHETYEPKKNAGKVLTTSQAGSISV